MRCDVYIRDVLGAGFSETKKGVSAGHQAAPDPGHQQDAKAELADLWERWCQVSDADGVLNFYRQQALVVRSWLDSGEVFVRKRVRRLDSGLEVPLQVQQTEAEFCTAVRRRPRCLHAAQEQDLIGHRTGQPGTAGDMAG